MEVYLEVSATEFSNGFRDHREFSASLRTLAQACRKLTLHCAAAQSVEEQFKICGDRKIHRLAAFECPHPNPPDVAFKRHCVLSHHRHI